MTQNLFTLFPKALMNFRVASWCIHLITTMQWWERRIVLLC